MVMAIGGRSANAQTANAGGGLPSSSQQLAQLAGNWPLIVPGEEAADEAAGGQAAAQSSGNGGSKFSERASSRSRNAPRRDNLQAFKVIKYVRGLVGGYEQGAGIGLGVEFTTADAIKGVELYARALTSSRLYRQGEVGAIIGNETNRAQIWFNYLRRTRDNFFGIGPQTLRSARTTFSVEARSYNASFAHNFAMGFEAGVYARVSNTGSFRGEDDEFPDINLSFTGDPTGADPTRYLPGLNSNAKLFSYGAFAELDKRDNERGLTRGAYLYGRLASVDGLKNGNAFSNYGWIETELDGRVYIPIFSHKTSLALRGYTELKETKSGGQIPFYELSFLGGRSHLRGFDNFRFRGENFAFFSGEFRQTVWEQEEHKGVDVFVFTDAGQVWGDNRSKTDPRIRANDPFQSENWRIGVGGGAQYRFNRSTAVRFELASTNERNHFYFSVSRGF
ncbi:MAG: BamA/TamA family outer membrane protein [Blastocatellia bacterium]|nr:BamA/TamA family outer membrane protein [Blastocatellia bacterium]